MATYANESSAWKRATGYVIFKGSRYVGKIYIAYPADGASVLRATCYQTGEAAERSGKVLAAKGWTGDHAKGYSQHGSAAGYGYDKKTAALSGMVIDGHELSDHCGKRKKAPKGGAWPYDAKAPRGWRFANYSQEAGGWTSCYRMEGLRYLEALGYSVVEL